jgi:hypothetical protein
MNDEKQYVVSVCVYRFTYENNNILRNESNVPNAMNEYETNNNNNNNNNNNTNRLSKLGRQRQRQELLTANMRTETKQRESAVTKKTFFLQRE